MVAALVRGAVDSYLAAVQGTDLTAAVLGGVLAPAHREGVSQLAQAVTGEAVRTLVTVAAGELRAQRGGEAREVGEGGRAEASPLRPPPRARRAMTLHSASPGGAAPVLSPPPRCALCEEGPTLLLSGRAAACVLCASGGCETVPGAAWSSGSSSSSDTGDAPRRPAPAPALPPSSDPSWTHAARAALACAAAPEARALLRDVAGAAAFASTRALLTAAPAALYAALPAFPRPFRRPPLAVAEAHDGTGPADADATGSPPPPLTVAPLRRGLETTGVQGALLMALLVHAAALLPV